jgi:hypothetical protein
MSLLYENYGIRRVAVEVNLWPDIERFDTKALSALFGTLNPDGVFSSVELRPEAGIRFEGDAWTYDLSPAGVLMRCSSFISLDEVKRRVHFLLDGTRKCVAKHHAFYTDEIRVFAHVPESGNRNIETTVSRKLVPARIDRSDLPGLEGAGLSLTGTEPEGFHWHANIDPYGPDALMLVGNLSFRPAPEPPRPGPDLDVIDGQIGTACSFVTENLRAFASKFIP